MECHSAIKAESPAIRKLAAYAKERKDIDWAPVYQLPEDVKFGHKPHLDKGTACGVCHGKVEDREQLYQEVDLSMGTCMDCHRAKQASIACTVCHEHK
jgi:Cytochrome c7 and related cytochrome c